MARLPNDGHTGLPLGGRYIFQHGCPMTSWRSLRLLEVATAGSPPRQTAEKSALALVEQQAATLDERSA